MGLWGWRQMAVVFVSVWVVGCSPAHNTVPTLAPTFTPHITLAVRISPTPPPPSPTAFTATAIMLPTPTVFIYTVQPGDTLLGLSVQFGVPLAALETANAGLDPLTLPIGYTLVIPSPLFDLSGRPLIPTAAPLAVQAPPPACADTPTDTVMCLGQVRNPLDQSVRRVTVRVALLDSGGGILAQAETGIEQALIPPGEAAPYRVLLNADWQAVAGVSATLLSADPAPPGPAVDLRIADERGRWFGRRYRIEAVLVNADAEPVRVLQVVATLRDVRGQVIGYRVLLVNTVLPPRVWLPLRLEIAASADALPTAHSLYIEARREPPFSG